MVQTPGPDHPGWTSLFGVTTTIARQLKGEPLLGTCFGVAAILALLGFFGPEQAVLHSWLLAGLTTVFGILWLIFRLRTGRPRQQADSPTPGSALAEFGDRADIGPVNQSTQQGWSVFRAGRRAKIASLTQHAGPSAVPEAPPTGPAAGPAGAAPQGTPAGPPADRPTGGPAA